MDKLLEGDVVADELFTKDHMIMGAKQKGARRAVLSVIPEKHPQKHHAHRFLEKIVKRNTHLFTDGGSIYKGMDKNLGIAAHTYEARNRFEFSLTAEIEGLWGVFRTFIRRMYHHVSAEKLEQYVCEFCLRFCRDEIFESLLNYGKICLCPCPLA